MTFKSFPQHFFFKDMKILAIVSLFFIFLLHSTYYFGMIIDDAFITFRVANNFVNGKGLIYNIGERVEAYSNFLWTILISAGILLGLSPFITTKILGFLFAIITVYIIGQILKLLNCKFWIIWCCLLTFSLNSFYIYWTQSGMENSLHIFLLTFAYYLFIRRNLLQENNTIVFSINLGLIVISRPEGALFVLPYILYELGRTIKIHNYRQSIILTIKTFIPTALIIVSFIIWRLIYYNDVLPNTYYAKAWLNFLPLQYIANFFTSPGWTFPLLWFMFFVFSILEVKQFKTILTMLWLQVLCSFFFTWYAKGDWMPSFRFLIPTLPFFYMLAGITLQKLYVLSKRNFIGLLMTIGVIIILAINTFSFSSIHRVKDTIDKKPDYWFLNFFSSITMGYDPPLTNECNYLIPYSYYKNDKPYYIALPDVGYPGYLTSFNVFDWQGLPNREIAMLYYNLKRNRESQKAAEQKFFEYFLKYEPAFVFILFDDNNTIPLYPAKLIYGTNRFKEKYSLISTAPYHSGKISLFKHRDFNDKKSTLTLLIELKDKCELDSFNAYLHYKLGEILENYWDEIDEKLRKECYQLLKNRMEFNFYSNNNLNILLAKLEIKNSELTAAENRLLRIVSRDTNQSSVSFLLGTVYQAKGDLEKSKEYFEAAIKEKPDAWTYASLGWIYMELKQYDSAREQFEKSVKLEPHEYFYWNYLGTVYEELKLREQAVETYKKSLMLNYQQEEIKNQVFNILETLGDEVNTSPTYSLAIEYYKQALDIRADSNLSLKLAKIYQLTDKDDEAVKVLEKSIHNNPNDAVAYFQLGNLYEKTGQLEKSIEAYKQSVSLKPDAWTYARLGWVYMALKQYDLAREQFEKSVQLEPNTYFYWNYLGMAYGKLKEKNRAVECFEKSLQLKPEQDSIKKILESLK